MDEIDRKLQKLETAKTNANRTATGLLSQTIQSTLPKRHKLVVQIMKNSGYISEEVEAIPVSECEIRTLLHHNVMYWLKCYRSYSAEYEAMCEVEKEFLPDLSYEDQELYIERRERKKEKINEIERAVDLIKSTMDKDGDICCDIIRFNYFQENRTPSEPWTYFQYKGKTLTKYKWYDLLRKAEEKLEEIFFGASRREDEQIIISEAFHESINSELTRNSENDIINV